MKKAFFAAEIQLLHNHIIYAQLQHFFRLHFYINFQWRIQDFPEGGREPSRGGREHAKFSRKLHEIERIWTPRGGRASLTPPLDPPMTFNDDLHKRFVSNSSSVESYLIHYLPNPQIMLHMMCTFPHAACSCRDYCSAANQYCHCVGSRRSNVGNVMITEIHSNAIRSTF